MDEFLKVYNNTSVFITGHTGFKGSWLTQWLCQLGSNITGFAQAPETEPNHYSYLDLGIKNIEGDVGSFQQLKEAIQKTKPEIVFHMAAQPIVRVGYQSPRQTYYDNIQGTVNLLESCRECDSVKAIVIITSDKCYKLNKLHQGYVESDPLGGYDPYSASKACVEIVTESYQKSFFNVDTYEEQHNVLLASVRAGNVIGGGDWSVDRIIPDLIRSVETQKPAAIRYPKATRPWQHVLECLYGYLLLGEKLLNGEKDSVGAWNFGPEQVDACNVEKIIMLSKEFWPKIKYEIIEDTKWYETSYLSLDYSKAKENLNWRPLFSVRERIEETINWFRAFYEDGEVLTNKHILKFQKKIQLSRQQHEVSINAK